MKILIFSWRDIKHPMGGGAELLTHEMAKRWASQGHQITHFSAMFPKGKKKEKLDGVNYIREGNWYDVHTRGFWNLITNKFGKSDIIIDQVHGIPFFAAIYSRTPVVCFPCEVAKEVWDQMYPFPINIIGKLFERIYLLLYRNIPFITISNSTKKDLIQNGIPARNITVIPMGFTHTLPKKLPKKSKVPTIIFLGRLAKSKGIPDAIHAFSVIKKKHPKAQMLVAGKGTPDYEKQLRKMVEDFQLSDSVDFKGFVSEEEKFKLLAKAHLILVPSVREGWGLIIPEANMVGTPAIVYKVPGLRDVTVTGRNGIVVGKNTSKELAKQSIILLKNIKQYQKLSRSSKKFAKHLNWDDTAEVALKVIKKAAKK